MNQYQRLFLVQSRTDYVVFGLLRVNSTLPACHALHYLQMSTEKLGKAYLWKQGPHTDTHRAFAAFLRSLSSNRKAQNQLGYQRKNANWKQLIRKSVLLAEEIEALAPTIAGDGPNPEYPWPRSAPTTAPAEHTFAIWRRLQTPAGRSFLMLLADLFAAAEAFL